MKIISTVLIFLAVLSFNFAQPTLFIYSQQPEENTLIPGQPLTLKVQVYDHRMELDYMNEVADNAYLEQLEEALENNEINDTIFQEERALLLGKPTSSYTIGTEASPWYDQVFWQFFSNGQWVNYPFPIPYLNGTERNAQHEISGQSRTEAPYGMTPDQTTKMTARQYQFRAGIMASGFSVDTNADTIWSNQVIVKTAASKSEYPKWSRLEKQYDLVFWYYKGDYDTVISKADGLLASDTLDVHTITYKADALAAKELFEEAAEWFEKGIDAYRKRYPDAYEPPGYLIERYNQVMGILIER